MKNKKGITLIALVITIIVLLILAGISIIMISSQDGILNRTSSTKEKWEIAKKEEQEKLYNIEKQVDISTSDLLDADANPELKDFITVWRVNDGESITLPLVEKSNNAIADMTGIDDAECKELKYDFEVDYGDGNVYQIKSYNDSNITHTYEKGGDYEVKIKGTCEGFSFYGKYGNTKDNEELRNKLIGLKQWGVVGMVEVSFDRCKKLMGTIPTPCIDSFSKIESMPATFRYCELLTGEIPKDFFLNMPNVTYLYSIFSGRRGLTGNIPTIKNLPKLRVAQSIFFNCENLTGEIPKDFLQGCTNIIQVHGLFYGNKNITGKIPENIFNNCPKLKQASSVFTSDEKLTGEIPENLFRDCKELKDIRSVLGLCTGLTGKIPENLFSNCTNLKDVSGIFEGCENLTGEIPENLFKNCTKIENFNYVFNCCKNLTGEIPENLFANCPEATNFGSAFAGCIKLTKIPQYLFAFFKKATTFKATFSNLDQDNQTLGEGITETTIMSFEGNALELWGKDITDENGKDCYRGCSKLDNYDNIPEEWK